MRFREIISDLSRHGSRYAFSGAAVAALNLISVPLYTRLFDPSQLGLYYALAAAGQFLVIAFGLGLDTALVRFFYEDYGDTHRHRSALSTYLTFGIVWGGLILILLSVTHRWILGPLLKTAYWPLICIMLVATFFQSIWQLLIGILQMEFRSKLLSTINVTISVLVLLITLLLVRYGHLGIEARFLAQSVTALLFVLIVFGFLLYRASLRFHFDRQVIKRGLTYSLPLAPNSGVGWITNLSDRLLLRYYNMTAAGGVYSIGYDLSRMGVSLMSDATYQIYAPLFFREMKRDAKSFAAQHARFVTQSLLLIAITSLLLIIFAGDIVRILMPHSYARASNIMPIVAYAFLFASLYRPFILILSYCNKTFVISAISIISAFSNLALNLLLIPHFGPQGAAWTTLISLGIWMVLSFVFAQRYFPIHYEYARVAKISVIHLILLLTWFSLPVHTVSAPVRFLLQVTCCLLFPGILFLSGFFNEQERIWLHLIRSPSHFLKQWIQLIKPQDAPGGSGS